MPGARVVAIIAALVGLTLWSVPAASANVYKPTRLDDPAPGACKLHDCSLREAVGKANNHPGPDSVVLRSGRIYLLSITGRGEDNNLWGDLDVHGKLLMTTNGNSLATIDAQRIDRVIDAHSPLTIKRLKLIHGESDVDGSNNCGCGINSNTNNNAPLTVLDSKLVGNREGTSVYGKGGGITKEGVGTLTVKRSLIANNHSTLDGGGILDESASRVLISHSRITGNTGGAGGGFEEFGAAPVTITHSLISGNRSISNIPGGGGLSSDSSNRFVISDSKVVGNRAAGPGGGIVNYGSPMTIVRSTIAKNRGKLGAHTIAGGGIANLAFTGITAPFGVLTIRNSTISGNHSDFNGGGIENKADGGGTATLIVTNSTITGNKAAQYGGGIDSWSSGSGAESVLLNAVTVAYNDADSDNAGGGFGGGLQNGGGSGSFTVENSLLAGNLAPTGPDCDGVFDSGQYNLLTTRQDCGGFVGTGDIKRANAKIGQLANNGGPTKTIALLAGSPAINRAGSGTPNRDQRGHLRHNPDIGAFERD